jgi:STE24 endopeptidase
MISPQKQDFRRLILAATLLLCAFSLRLAAQTPTAAPLPAPAATQTEASAPPRPYTLAPERAAKAIAYARTRRRIYFIDTAWGFLVLFLILHCKVSASLRRLADAFSPRPFLQAAVFAPLLLAVLDLADLPVGAVRHWLASAYGLSVQGWMSWLLDIAKGSVLELLLGIPIVWLLFAIMRKSPRRWWFYGWMAAVPLMVFSVFISPWLIDPLFFDFKPLAPAHPDLAAQIERITAHAGHDIPQSRMFVMNASSKLNELNAYVTGLGASLRVVVWDTIIARLSAPQLLSVFGHEMGHYVLGHERAQVIFGAAGMFLALWLGSRILRWALGVWGARWDVRGTDDLAALPALLLIFSLFNFVSAPFTNAYSRYQEHQADQYGLEVLHGVVPDASAAAAGSLQILGDEDLEEPSPSPAVVFWFYTHPPIRDRIAFAYEYNPWAAGRSPEFVK